MERWIHKQKRGVSLLVALLLAMVCAVPVGFMPQAEAAAADHVVISEIYGGAGNSGATYKYDFIELYNPTDSAVSLEGWSVQYASAGGSSWSNKTVLSGIIAPHGYYLIQEAKGSGGSVDLPAPYATGTIAMSGTAGKVALVTTDATITGKTDPAVIDFVGFGSANEYEGSGPAPAPSNTTSVERKANDGSDPTDAGAGMGNGWDTDNNASDFVTATPNPQNSASPAEPAAGGGSGDTGTGGSGGSGGGGDTGGSGGSSGGGSGGQTPPGTVTPSADLKTNDANGQPTKLNDGKTYTIEGIATVASEVLGSGQFYVQDGTAGINVYGAGNASVHEGDRVRITGTVAFYRGLTEIKPGTVEILAPGQPLPAPRDATVAELSAYETAEPLEGQLVRTSGMITNVPTTPDSGGGYNITLQDEQNHVLTVRVMRSTGIDTVQLRVNQPYTVTGLVAQYDTKAPYDTGYEIFPRSASDLAPVDMLTVTPDTIQAYAGMPLTFAALVQTTTDAAVTVYYRLQGDTFYQSLEMTPDGTGGRYVATLSADKVPAAGKTLEYYYLARAGALTAGAGSEAQPLTVTVQSDTAGPVFTDEYPKNGSESQSKRPLIRVSLQDPSCVDTGSLHILLDGVDVTTAATITTASTLTEVQIQYQPPSDLTVQTHTVKVIAKDTKGNESSFEWTFNTVPVFTGGNHYRGTTHDHDKISHDATGELQDEVAAAKAHHYDWITFTDHSHDIDASLVDKDTIQQNGSPVRGGGSHWQELVQTADADTVDGQFVVFPSFEMTSTTWGHSNVFTTTTPPTFIDRVQGNGYYQDLGNYYKYLESFPEGAAVAQFNHPHMPETSFNNFAPYDPQADKYVDLLEVGNGSGHYSYTLAEDKFYHALDLGWHVAPTYGEDNHDATWGQTSKRTVIVAPSLTRKDLLDAMHNLHVYMEEDPNFQLDVTANGYYMGATVDSNHLAFDIKGQDPVAESPTDPAYSYLPKTYAANDNIAKVELITNGGRVVASYQPKDNETSFAWTPEVTASGQQWYVVKVTQKDGDRIYSAPIWSQAVPVDVKLTSLGVKEGALVVGAPATLTAQLSNTGEEAVNVQVSFYYDRVDDAHLIGAKAVGTVQPKASAEAAVAWNSVAPATSLIAVIQNIPGDNPADNTYTLPVNVKAPLGITVMIDASHQNENTSTDPGKYRNNMNTIAQLLRQQGYTVVENQSPLTPDVLSQANVLIMTYPSTALTDEESRAVSDFVQRGGGLFLLSKSNYGADPTRVNPLLETMGATIRLNDDGVYDDSSTGNYWSKPSSAPWAVLARPEQGKHPITDGVRALEYFSGSSLTGPGAAPLADTDAVKILVRGNETSYQVDLGKNGHGSHTYDAHSDDHGGSAIPLIAVEQVGQGRILVSGMNILNDMEIADQNLDSGDDNGPFGINAVKWLSSAGPTVTPIAEARKLPVGSEVVVEGTVTSAAGVFFDAFYLQDGTGGIMAFKEVPEGSLKEGDRVRVHGHIKVFENNLELEFDSFTKDVVPIGHSAPVPPIPMQTGRVKKDEVQGQLVEVIGQVVSKYDANSYVINDGTGDALVFTDGYIVNQSGPVPDLTPGDWLEAAGFPGQFADGYRIRVRNTKELRQITRAGADIPASSEGRVNLGSFVQVSVPAGAFSKDVHVNIQPVPPNSNPPEGVGLARLTPVFEITKDAQVGFNQPVTIQMQFDPDQVGGARVAMYYYDEQSRRWVGLPTTVEGNTASARVDHFTKFAVFAVSGNNGDNGSGSSDGPGGSSGGTGGGGGSSTPVLQSLDLDSSSYSLKVGESHATAVKAVYGGGWSQDVTGLSTYRSSNPSVAEVDSRGRVTGKAPGTAEITAVYQGKSVTATVQVTQAQSNSPGPSAPGQPVPGQPTPGQSTPGQPSPGAVRFSDVHGHWAEALVNQAVAQDWVKGYPDGTFHPDAPVTRAEFAVLLAKALGLPVPEGTAALPFADAAAVPDWARPSVAACVRAGVLHGYEDGTVRADAQISRAEMAVMAAKALGLPGSSGAAGFADDGAIPGWAKASVAAVKQAGLVKGREMNRFEPDGITTRAEAVAVLLGAREYGAAGSGAGSNG
ncbi:DUF4350 domain-containing protein [Kyrpidia tusciae]|uniref:Ig domain protein group 2 domain protein n=1 Tax=Kyrpidia tusciae (strain DSM 2912 / NBRC 15312 / T2) TaxID=562970 RepID=D5WRU1_KYRT2|nr:DUF4350 domain-containing protein [Kyrpidia tusciae]ADG06893.1 Ig domain protein group 2 domain protein [Kyrpidia tusciae DSM 2912]